VPPSTRSPLPRGTFLYIFHAFRCFTLVLAASPRLARFVSGSLYSITYPRDLLISTYIVPVHSVRDGIEQPGWRPFIIPHIRRMYLQIFPLRHRSPIFFPPSSLFVSVDVSYRIRYHVAREKVAERDSARGGRYTFSRSVRAFRERACCVFDYSYTLFKPPEKCSLNFNSPREMILPVDRSSCSGNLHRADAAREASDKYLSLHRSFRTKRLLLRPLRENDAQLPEETRKPAGGGARGGGTRPRIAGGTGRGIR